MDIAVACISEREAAGNLIAINYNELQWITINYAAHNC